MMSLYYARLSLYYAMLYKREKNAEGYNTLFTGRGDRSDTGGDDRSDREGVTDLSPKESQSEESQSEEKKS